MAVKLRLMRFGCKNRPFYRVVVADSRCRRDGTHLEILGYYNPLSGQDDSKRMSLKLDRVQHWLSVGAQPTEPVQRLLSRATRQKGGPRDTHVVDPATGRIISDTPKIIHPEFENQDGEIGKEGSA